MTLELLLAQWEQDFVEESHHRTVAAAAQAIRESVGNLPFPTEDVEVFISASSERLGALLRHDITMWVMRMHQKATSGSANPGPPRYEITGPINEDTRQRCTAYIRRGGHGSPLVLCNVPLDGHFSMDHAFRGKSGW